MNNQSGYDILNKQSNKQHMSHALIKHISSIGTKSLADRFLPNHTPK